MSWYKQSEWWELREQLWVTGMAVSGSLSMPFRHLSRAGAKSKVLTADFYQHRAARRHMLMDHLFMEYNSVGNGPALTENYERESQRMKIIT